MPVGKQETHQNGLCFVTVCRGLLRGTVTPVANADSPFPVSTAALAGPWKEKRLLNVLEPFRVGIVSHYSRT